MASRHPGQAASARARWLLIGLWTLAAACSDGLAEVVEIAAPRCTVMAASTIEEGEALTLDLHCAEGLALPKGLELSVLPEGATYDVRRSQLHWTPSLAQAGRQRFAVRDATGHELGHVQIDVLDRFTHPDNVLPNDPEHYVSEHGLPVIHLGLSPTLNDDEHEPASFVYQGQRYANVTAKYRGATSRAYPKRSYTVKFDKHERFVDETRGFRGARRIVLTTTFDDNAYLRQRLAFELWNRQDDSHIPIHTFHAVLFVDGEYRGLYLVSDHIDDDFLAGAGVFAHGNLYKARDGQANFQLERRDGSPKQNLHEGYTKEEGVPLTDLSDLDELVRFVAATPDAEFAQEFAQRTRQDELIDWLIFTNAIAATDTVSKNIYLYHDPRPDTPDARWRLLPWDFNASFGQNYATRRLDALGYALADFDRYNALFARLLHDETLHARVQERYRAALQGPWAVDQVLALVERWSREIDASALRDETRWGEAYRAYDWGKRSELTDYRQELAYVRTWIAERWSFIASSL